MWSLALIFGDIFPMWSVILLQFLRSDALFISLGLIFMADYMRTLLFEKRSARDFIMVILVMAVFTDFTAPHYLGPIMFIFLLNEGRQRILLFLRNKVDDPKRFFDLLWISCVITLICASAIFIFTQVSKVKIGFMMVFLIFLVTAGERRMAPFISKGYALAAILSILLIPHVPVMQLRLSDRSLTEFFDIRDKDWRDAQLWARDNTPIDAAFIIPLDMNGFRVLSKRSVFLDWVDGSAMHWVPGFEEKWAERLARLGYTRSFMEKTAGLICGLGASDQKIYHKEIYGNLNEEIFRSIKRDNLAQYVVEDVSKSLSFKIVYENTTFRIYRID